MISYAVSHLVPPKMAVRPVFLNQSLDGAHGLFAYSCAGRFFLYQWGRLIPFRVQ